MGRSIRIAVAALGLSALLVATASAQPAGKTAGKSVTFKTWTTNGPVQRPHHIYASPASRFAPAAFHLNHWRHWGSGKTHSTGRLYNPPHRGLVPGKAILSGIHRCSGHQRYGHLHLHYTNKARRDWSINFNCEGNPTKIRGPGHHG
jgi:hypothetical protein